MAANNKFTLDDAMGAGWELTKTKFWPYFGCTVLSLFLILLPQLAQFGANYAMQDDLQKALVTLGTSLAGGIMSSLMALGLVNIQLRILDRLPVASDNLWAPAGKFWAYVGAMILYGFMVTMGTLFFVVPGIILGITFMFFPYFLVEHRCGPIESLKASAAITEGAKWELFFLVLVLAIIKSVAFVFGLLLLGIPYTVSLMFSELTVTEVYRKLLAATPAEQFGFPIKTIGIAGSGIAEPPTPQF